MIILNKKGDIMEFLTTLRIVFATLLVMVAWTSYKIYKERSAK